MTDQTTHPPIPELGCDEVRDLAASFVLDALEPDEADALRDHLAWCPQAHEEMIELATQMNRALGSYVEESTNRLVKRKGRYVRKKESAA